MQLTVDCTVNGYVERQAKDLRIFRSVDLYVKGKDPGNLRVNIPESNPALAEQAKASEGKTGRAVVELRKFEQTGRWSFELLRLELNGVPPVKH